LPHASGRGKTRAPGRQAGRRTAARARVSRLYSRQPNARQADLTPNATDLDEASSGPRQRELQLFFLYRLFEAFLLAFLVFSPVGGLLGGVHSPKLAATVSVAYLVF